MYIQYANIQVDNAKYRTSISKIEVLFPSIIVTRGKYLPKTFVGYSPCSGAPVMSSLESSSYSESCSASESSYYSFQPSNPNLSSNDYHSD